MKVKELIEKLKELDQDKGIWVVYDGFDAFPPLPDDCIDSDEARYLNEPDTPDEEMVKEGDYLITAG